jgi:tRNA A22 N-methylase
MKKFEKLIEHLLNYADFYKIKIYDILVVEYLIKSRYSPKKSETLGDLIAFNTKSEIVYNKFKAMYDKTNKKKMKLNYLIQYFLF